MKSDSPFGIGPGSIAYEAIVFLRESPECKTATLAASIGRSENHLPGQLAEAVKLGYIRRRTIGKHAMWSAGPNADTVAVAPPDDDPKKVVKVSAQAAPSIFAYADTRRCAAFSTSLSTDGRLTIERYGRVLLELTDAERQELLKTAAKGVQP